MEDLGVVKRSRINLGGLTGLAINFCFSFSLTGEVSSKVLLFQSGPVRFFAYVSETLSSERFAPVSHTRLKANTEEAYALRKASGGPCPRSRLVSALFPRKHEFSLRLVALVY